MDFLLWRVESQGSAAAMHPHGDGRHAVFDRKELNSKTSNVALLTGFNPVVENT
jgi:hypothetical protein